MIFIAIELLTLNKDKLQFNTLFSSDTNKPVSLSPQDKKYADYTKLLFAIYNNETDEISNLASNIKQESKTHFLVMELLESFNYDLALKKC
ncbi:MAG: hypothetical protein ACJ0GZ_02410 [Alphaproteobacteria bacterium]